MRGVNNKSCIRACLLGLVLVLGTIFNPIKAEAVIKPSGDYYVTDYNGVISDDVKDYIMRVNELFSLEEESPEIALVVVPSLEGQSIEDYAYQQLNSMNLGTARYKNGVLILLAPNEREIRVQIGEGLQRAITDQTAGMIIDKSMDSLRNNDFSTAIYEIFARLAIYVQDEYDYSIIEVEGNVYTYEESQAISGFITIGIFLLISTIVNFVRHVSMCNKEGVALGLTIKSFFDPTSKIGIRSLENRGMECGNGRYRRYRSGFSGGRSGGASRRF